MSHPEPADQKPISAVRRLLRFLISEIKHLWLAFWKPFWKVTAATATLFFLILAVLVFSGEPPAAAGAQVPQQPPIVLTMIYSAGFSLFYAFWIGLVVGGIRVLWHLVGGWFIVPVIVIPLAIVLSLWLCSGWIADEGGEAMQALVDSAKAKGIPRTEEAAKPIVEGALKGAHGGGIESLAAMAALVAVLLAPFLVIDGFWIAVDANFLWQFLQFILCFVAAVLLGLIPSSLFSIVLVSFSFVKRMRRRYRDFVAESGLS